MCLPDYGQQFALWTEEIWVVGQCVFISKVIGISVSVSFRKLLGREDKNVWLPALIFAGICYGSQVLPVLQAQAKPTHLRSCLLLGANNSWIYELILGCWNVENNVISWKVGSAGWSCTFAYVRSFTDCYQLHRYQLSLLCHHLLEIIT